jgi:hypothetical protein
MMLLVHAVSGLLVYAILELPFWADMLIGTIFTLMDTVVAFSSPGTSRREQSAEPAAAPTLRQIQGQRRARQPAIVFPAIMVVWKLSTEAVFEWLPCSVHGTHLRR